MEHVDERGRVGRVGAVSQHVGGELTCRQAANMPTDITEHACGTTLVATLVAKRPSVLQSKVESVGSREANSRGRMGGFAHGGANSGYRREGGEEVDMRGRREGGVTQRVEGSGQDALVGQLEVVEGL